MSVQSMKNNEEGRSAVKAATDKETRVADTTKILMVTCDGPTHGKPEPLAYLEQDGEHWRVISQKPGATPGAEGKQFPDRIFEDEDDSLEVRQQAQERVREALKAKLENHEGGAFAIPAGTFGFRSRLSLQCPDCKRVHVELNLSDPGEPPTPGERVLTKMAPHLEMNNSGELSVTLGVLENALSRAYSNH